MGITLPVGVHNGFDLSTGKKGTAKLYSIIDGIVVSKNWISGNQVYIQRDDGLVVGYGHMEYPALVNIGDKVVVGQQVGYEGNTGNSSGYHVHVEIHDKNGILVNPADFMALPNEAGISVWYNGIPTKPPYIPTEIKKSKFNWVLFRRKGVRL